MGKQKKPITFEKTDTSYEGLEELEAAGEAAAPDVRVLPLSMIRIADEVFQMRDMTEDPIASEAHVRGLMEHLEDAGTPFDPLLVVFIGTKAWLVDGHHRHAAYRSFGWEKPVPVEVFKGNLREAFIASRKHNSKNKLPVSKRSKQEDAWKIVKRGRKADTIKLIHEITGTSERTVSTMRKVLKEHQGKVMELTWAQTLRLSWVREDPENDDWRQRKQEEFEESMIRHGLAKMLGKYPDIVADALVNLKPEFAGVFCSQFPEVAEEAVRELEAARSLDI